MSKSVFVRVGVTLYVQGDTETLVADQGGVVLAAGCAINLAVLAFVCLAMIFSTRTLLTMCQKRVREACFGMRWAC